MTKVLTDFLKTITSELEYGLHDANVATRECRRQADVRRYYKKCTYANKASIFIILLAFFAYIHTFIEWNIVHVGGHSTKNATPMESRFIVLSFYLTIWDYS